MEKNRLAIQLTAAHRGVGSTLFTGRPEGRKVREELKLDEMDQKDYEYNVYIPSGTTSINASFFLGLFFNSIKALGSVDTFKKKYLIDLSQVEKPLRPFIERNLKECFRKAENEMNDSTGLD
ncbi:MULTISPECIES: hypothetical protein [Bacteroides]|jgi:hypothetical protein|uniref:hypothetical protein n=1 Tax=Bacteroides TaxID=816 RepID=UPI000E44584D|nr:MULTISPECIES: hypothetical protein [Bacteroides]RGM45636.1 hypothetical protein DXC10_13050 [Bacteroides sp. OM08-11]